MLSRQRTSLKNVVLIFLSTVFLQSYSILGAYEITIL